MHKQVATWLNTEAAVSTSGFAIGFVSVVASRSDSLQFPLSAMVSAGLSGLLCRYGAECLSDMLIPKEFRFLFPLMACASCFYYVKKACR